MSHDPFTAALRAELDAIVARYEALSRAHQEALAAAREVETGKLRSDLSTLLADRERARKSEGDLRELLRAQTDRADRLERDLVHTQQSAATQQQAAQAEADRKIQALQAEADRKLQAAQAALDAARADAARQQAAAEAHARATADHHRQQLDELTTRLARSEADARARIDQLTDARARAEQRADSLDEAFAAERALVAAAAPLAGSALGEALRAALGADLDETPATFAALKARRPDAVLAAALKDRGRTVVTAPLTDAERSALPALAAAAGCELITPDRGARFASAAMDKAATRVDPAEEGNVLDVLSPGLRLAGTDGTMVAPRVVVATG